MPYLTTGLFDNTAVAGLRPSSTLSVKIANDDISTVAIQIEGSAHRVVAREFNPF